MTSGLVPFPKTAKRLQEHDIHFQNFILLETLILLHFLEGENSQHGFTTGQMKIRESQRQRGAQSNPAGFRNMVFSEPWQG